jgi:hypothetical protein
MALTLDTEQALENAGLIAEFEKDRATWLNAAKQSHDFVKQNFPAGATIRCDDVAKALLPVLEVSEALNDFLASKKLKQKYWIKYFGDLILDRTWDEITKPGGQHGNAQPRN